MAGLKSIDEARAALEASLFDLSTIMQVCDGLSSGDSHPWVFMVRSRVDRIDEQAQAYMRAVHEHALPVLRDMAVISRR